MNSGSSEYILLYRLDKTSCFTLVDSRTRARNLNKIIPRWSEIKRKKLQISTITNKYACRIGRHSGQQGPHTLQGNLSWNEKSVTGTKLVTKRGLFPTWDKMTQCQIHLQKEIKWNGLANRVNKSFTTHSKIHKRTSRVGHAKYGELC